MDLKEVFKDCGYKEIDESDHLKRGDQMFDYNDMMMFAKAVVKKLTTPVVSCSSKPEPPKPPLSRVLRTGVGHLCKNCNSTMPKSGFLMLFGKRYCDNKKCPNSKPEKNYY